jgi:hypothetical protein
MKKNKLPNFLIVGAGKSGTTSLYHYLKQHPDICMSENKEPCFFVSDYYKNVNSKSINYENIQRRVVFNFSQYKELFNICKNEKLRGESSVDYLYSYKMAIPNIKKYIGDVKIIIILRDPVGKAFSNYTHQFEFGNEVLSFEEALKKEDQRIKEGYSPATHYATQAFYYEQVKAYIDNFSDVKVCLFDDLKSDNIALVQDIYKFLEVDDSFVPMDDDTFNKSGVPKNRLLHTLLMKDNKLKKILRPTLKVMIPSHIMQSAVNYLRNKNLAYTLKIKQETKEKLQKEFEDDIRKLEELINRDLKHWMK